MYLHAGNGFSVNTDDIVGIFDLENTTTDRRYTREFLDRAEKEKRCVYTTEEMPKSFIVTEKNGIETVYISQLAVSTLRKRLG